MSLSLSRSLWTEKIVESMSSMLLSHGTWLCKIPLPSSSSSSSSSSSYASASYSSLPCSPKLASIVARAVKQNPKGFGAGADQQSPSKSPLNKKKKKRKGGGKATFSTDEEEDYDEDEWDDEESDSEESVDPDEDVVPEVVTNRMLKRIGYGVGIPLGLGLLFFPIFWYLKVGLKVDVPEWLPLLVSGLFFGSSGFGITYGIVSTSWDPKREGSLLGWTEAQANWPLFFNNLQGQKTKKSKL